MTVVLGLLGVLGVSSPATAAHHLSGCERVVEKASLCSRIHVFGHRGRQWSVDTNENTLFAFRADETVGAGFETDTWVLADGTAVVFHDKTLARVVDPDSMPTGVTPKTRITDLTLPQFQQLQTKGGQPLITLKHLIRFSGQHRLRGIIENKYSQLNAPQVAAWIHQFHAPVAVYQTPKCHDGQVIPPPWAGLSVRVGAKNVGACRPSSQDLAAAGFDFIITGVASITRNFVYRAHRSGLEVGNFDSGKVGVWTQLVNARADYLVAPRPARAERWLG